MSFKGNTSDQLSKQFYHIGIIESPPFTIKVKDNSGNTIDYNGIIVEIVDILSSQLRFNYSLVLQSRHGIRLPNGTWTGAMGSLIRKEVDMVAADLSLTLERKQQVDFTVPYLQSTIGVVIRTPEENPTFMNNLTTYLDPFQSSIWLLILLLWIVAAVLYHKTENYRRRNIRVWKRNFQNSQLTPAVNWSSALFTLLEIFLRQSFELPSHRSSARIVLLTVCLAAFASYSFYTSVLVSFATATKISHPVDSLQHVYRDPSFQVGFVESAYINHISTTAQPAFKEAWSRMQKSKNPYVRTNEEGVTKAYHEKFAHIADVNSLRWLTFKNCSFRLLKDKLMNEGIHFVLPLRSPDTNIFSKQLNLLIENGVMARLRSIWMPEVPPEFCKVPKKFEMVTLVSSTSVFLCLFLGIVAACIFLCFEILVSHHANHNTPSPAKERTHSMR